jgi:hypothetical protein
MSFARIVWNEKNSFMLDLSRINGQFATDSDGNLPRVIAHSQSPARKINFKDL